MDSLQEQVPFAIKACNAPTTPCEKVLHIQILFV